MSSPEEPLHCCEGLWRQQKPLFVSSAGLGAAVFAGWKRCAKAEVHEFNFMLWIRINRNSLGSPCNSEEDSRTCEKDRIRDWLWLTRMPGGCQRSPGFSCCIFLLKRSGTRGSGGGSRGGAEQAPGKQLDFRECVCCSAGVDGQWWGEVKSPRQPEQATHVSWDTHCCTTGPCEGATIQNFRSANYC